MDEPEAHLHPEWQVKLINILYKVAQAGANIIIATHSIDMIKAVELLIKQDEDAKNLISLNKMPYNSDFTKLEQEDKIEEMNFVWEGSAWKYKLQKRTRQNKNPTRPRWALVRSLQTICFK